MLKQIKKPSILGKGYLGQQALVKRFASKQHTNAYRTSQRSHVSLLPTPRDYYSSEIEGLCEFNNNWAWGCCPFHPDNNPSFTVNLESGSFRCMSSSCGKKRCQSCQFRLSAPQLQCSRSQAISGRLVMSERKRISPEELGLLSKMHRVASSVAAADLTDDKAALIDIEVAAIRAETEAV